MRRVLITGSRQWVDGQAIMNDLDAEYDLSGGPTCDEFTVVHGGAAGADRLAGLWVKYRIDAGFHNVYAEVYRPDWDGKGRKAGILRNLHMVNLGADRCLAYIYDNSRGATHCATAANAAGIDTRITRFDSAS